MLTDKIKKDLEEIQDFINEHTGTDETGPSVQGMNWIDMLDRVMKLLRIAPDSYKFNAEQQEYIAECDCGWWGNSSLLDGGHQIADTGDYGNCYCPVCGSTDFGEKENNPN